jgi:hypothetical protein
MESPARQSPPSAGAAIRRGARVADHRYRLVFMAAEGYHVALAAGTIARNAAGAAMTAGFLTAAPLGAPYVGESTLESPSELGRMETVHSKRLG